MRRPLAAAAPLSRVLGKAMGARLRVAVAGRACVTRWPATRVDQTSRLARLLVRVNKARAGTALVSTILGIRRRVAAAARARRLAEMTKSRNRHTAA